MSANQLPWGTKREALLRALRRRDRDEALRLMAFARRPDEPPHPPLAWAQSHHVDDGPWTEAEDGSDILGNGAWALAETARHTAAGRFEHAICLIERYGGCYCATADSGVALMIFANGDTK